MIFQDPTTNLNPLFTIGEQLVDAILHRQSEDGDVPGRWKSFLPSARQLRREAHATAVELMRLVGIPDGARRLENYPHEFSGGMRQRVLIAIALSGKPELLIADEPTTALDVTIQAQILRLINDLVEQFGLSVLLITHNLGVVAKSCEKVAVMYSGQVVEQAGVRDLFGDPRHPYTQGLLRAIPTRKARHGRIAGIPGSIPSLINPPGGCRFHPRCPRAMDICRRKAPVRTLVAPGHSVRCHLHEGTA